MKPKSLFQIGKYSQDWVKEFYAQADTWWGADPGAYLYPTRIRTFERLCGQEPKRILELGAGSGGFAAALADVGHSVVAVELSPAIRHALELAKAPREGSLTSLEADFYTVVLEGRFDVVCCWECFGIGSDADQRRLLKRIARDWLAPGGCALLEVYSPFRATREAGSETLLPPLEGVPGSVEMIERCYFDPVQSRWIDEWQPTAEPERALAQAIRCYTPADLLLLLEGIGLALKRVEVDGQQVDFASNVITISGPMLEAYSYLAVLVLLGESTIEP
ncbi:MAG: class I SAM-dependent methyltransferase [Anaerolineales bacterium]|nr:class I SAM-dependent methyltransferase [Anaerolineales bacterium]